jgi:hypothetical protein
MDLRNTSHQGGDCFPENHEPAQAVNDSFFRSTRI